MSSKREDEQLAALMRHGWDTLMAFANGGYDTEPSTHALEDWSYTAYRWLQDYNGIIEAELFWCVEIKPLEVTGLTSADLERFQLAYSRVMHLRELLECLS